MTAAAESRPIPLESNRSQLRVLVVHEWLYTWAGAERCLEEVLAVVPQADVLAGIVTPDMRGRHAIARRAAETWVGRLPGAHRHHRWFLPLHALAFATFDTSKYDLVISLSHAFEKLIPKKKGAAHVCYCFSPPRYLWDLRATYERHAPRAQRIALRVATLPLRAVDKHGASGVDRFVSISSTVAERVRRCYGRESDIVYPPVSAKPTAAHGAHREPFLLSLGRLVPYKRVDLAILAAERLGLRLVIAGDGPERVRLEKLAGAHTEFLGEVSEDEAGRLLSTCSAFVFCGEEDFGIAPAEANAHGAPVVGYGRGGLVETMVPGRTAVLFEEQSVDAVARALEVALTRSWDEQVMRANAQRFSAARFRTEFGTVLESAVTERVNNVV